LRGNVCDCVCIDVNLIGVRINVVSVRIIKGSSSSSVVGEQFWRAHARVHVK
jgi:hypothetical protein